MIALSGVFEAVAIRKQGFPFRLKHDDFVTRYAKICRKDVRGGSAKETAATIIKHMKLSAENVRIGKSRVLYRAQEYRKLELEWEIVTKNERIREALEKYTKVTCFYTVVVELCKHANSI